MRKPTPAMIVALLSLFVALGGVGWAATGGNFILGQSNTAGNTTSLSAGITGGKALQVSNMNTAGGSTALGLNVASGHAPLAVNSPTKVPNLNADRMDGIDSTGFWKLSGNAGSIPGTHFLGTTDNQPLELKVNGQRALRIEPAPMAYPPGTPNIIGGFGGNAVLAGALGATIAGGGGDFGNGNFVSDEAAAVGGGAANQAGNFDGSPNSARFATVAGGCCNRALAEESTVGGGGGNKAAGAASVVAGGLYNMTSSPFSAVPGGYSNTASGEYSFAAGNRAKATHFGSLVWADGRAWDIGSYGPDTFTARTTGGARFISAIDTSTGTPTAGVELAAGGGSWSSLSDRAAKRGFTPVDRRTLLQRLDRVPISRWGYKSQAPSIRHLGPTAQDFFTAFGLGEDNRHIDTIDSEGVALAAVQGLYRQNQALERKNKKLNSRLARQNARLTRLEREVAKLSR